MNNGNCTFNVGTVAKGAAQGAGLGFVGGALLTRSMGGATAGTGVGTVAGMTHGYDLAKKQQEECLRQQEAARQAAEAAEAARQRAEANARAQAYSDAQNKPR